MATIGANAVVQSSAKEQVVRHFSILMRSSNERRHATSQPERPGVPVRALEPPFDVHSVVRQVRYAYRQEGHGWRGGYQTYEVRVRADVGLEMSPYSWPAPSRLDGDRGEPGARIEGSALRLGPATFSRGGQALKSRQPVVAQRPDGALELRTQAATEHMVNREAGFRRRDVPGHDDRDARRRLCRSQNQVSSRPLANLHWRSGRGKHPPDPTSCARVPNLDENIQFFIICAKN